MIDEKDLKKFMKLPPVFTLDAMIEIEKALELYTVYCGTIRCDLELYNDEIDGYKNPAAYYGIAENIRNSKYPRDTKEKYLAVIAEMKAEYCRD